MYGIPTEEELKILQSTGIEDLKTGMKGALQVRRPMYQYTRAQQVPGGWASVPETFGQFVNPAPLPGFFGDPRPIPGFGPIPFNPISGFANMQQGPPMNISNRRMPITNTRTTRQSFTTPPMQQPSQTLSGRRATQLGTGQQGVGTMPTTQPTGISKPYDIDWMLWQMQKGAWPEWMLPAAPMGPIMY